MIATKNIQTVLEDLDFPEGPAFDSKGNLWFVELKGGFLGKWHNGHLERFATQGAPNGIAIDADDTIWFCDAEQCAIRVFYPDTQKFETVVDTIEGKPLFKPNDLAFDSRGNLIFTCPGDSRDKPTGYVCVFTRDGALKKIAKNLYFPNGLAFSADGERLLIAETYKHRLWKGDWNQEALQIENFKPWAEVGGPIGPDGMAFDQNGNLYVAVYGQQCIKQIDPSGTIKDEIPLAGKNPTNCAFQKNTLFITEAEQGTIVQVTTPYDGVQLFKK